MNVMQDTQTANPRRVFRTEGKELAKPRFDANLVETILDVRLCNEDLAGLSGLEKLESLGLPQVGFMRTPEVLVRPTTVEYEPLAPPLLCYKER